MRDLRVTPILILALLAAACAASSGMLGAPGYEEILPDQRIPISDSGSGAGKWQAQEAIIEYRYERVPGGLEMSGTLDFIDSIKYNYGLLSYFNAGVIFGDSDGRVLRTAPLVVTRQGGLERWSGERFSRRVAMPPGAMVFSFTYDGEVMGVGGGRHGGGGGNPTRLWYYPVGRMRPPEAESK